MSSRATLYAAMFDTTRTGREGTAFRGLPNPFVWAEFDLASGKWWWWVLDLGEEVIEDVWDLGKGRFIFPGIMVG